MQISGEDSCSGSRIYVIGGNAVTNEGEEMPASSLVQIFDVNTGLTLMATPLPVAAPDVRAVVVDHHIYALTGKHLFVMEELEELEEVAEEAEVDQEELVEEVEVGMVEGERGGIGTNKSGTEAQLEAAIAALQLQLRRPSAESQQPMESTDATEVNGEPSLEPPIPNAQAVEGNTLEPVPTPIRSSTPPITISVEWKQLASIPTTNPHNTFMTTASALRHRIYLFGGFRSRRVSIFDTLEGRWGTNDTIGEEMEAIRPIGSVSVVAPIQVFGLEECRSPLSSQRGPLKVIPRRRK